MEANQIVAQTGARLFFQVSPKYRSEEVSHLYEED